MFTSQHDYPSGSSCIGIKDRLQAPLVLEESFTWFHERMALQYEGAQDVRERATERSEDYTKGIEETH